MFNKIKKALSFLRILDETGQLSITNILVVTFAVKFAFVPMQSASIQDMALALAAMGVYVGKKAINGIVEAKKNTLPEELIGKLKSMTEG